jgi:hypothetical protein
MTLQTDIEKVALNVPCGKPPANTLFGVISQECKPLLLFGIIIVNFKYADQDEFSGNAL